MNLESTENSSSTKVSNVTLGGLIIVALVLGYFVYQKITNTQTAPPASEPENNTTEPFTFRPLSTDEREALNMPKSADAPEAVFVAHNSFVQKAAIASDIIAIGIDCKVYPAILKTRKDKNLTFKNYDTVSHTITFDQTRSFSIPAKGSITVLADFGEIRGTYGYGCETSDSTMPIGIVWLAE